MTTTGLLLYSAFSLMILTVLSNRYWRAHIQRLRSTVRRLQDDVDTATRDLRDAVRAYGDLAQQAEDAERRMVQAEQEAARVEAELGAMRQAAIERYYVFDRLEPRFGRFWEAAVRRAPENAGRGSRQTPSQSWVGLRRYLLVADNEREARERITGRFQARDGFEVAELVPCRLAALAVNRVSDVAPFPFPHVERSSGADGLGSARRMTARSAASG